MKPAPFSYLSPKSTNEALAALATPSTDSKIIAGGQSLGPMLNLRLARPAILVDVSRLPEIRQSRRTAQFVDIGAAVTHAEIEDGCVAEPIAGMLRHVAAGIAYRAVRNKGTIGGSLCHADPAADWLSAMTVLDARVVVTGPSGQTRTVAVTEFVTGAYRTCLGPDEMVSAVRIPAYSEKACWGYYKICRKVGEFADAIGTFVADPEKQYCRVVVGSTNGPPIILDALARDLAHTATPPPMMQIEQQLRSSGIAVGDIKFRQLAVALYRSIAWTLRDA